MSTTVIEAIAALENADPLDLPPLYDQVDGDVIDVVFDVQRGERFDIGDPIHLRLDRHTVTITSDGEVTASRV